MTSVCVFESGERVCAHTCECVCILERESVCEHKCVCILEGETECVHTCVCVF